MSWKRHHVLCRGAAVLIAAVLATPLVAENTVHDWAQFRGPDRDGISTETGLLTTWPEEGPKEVWRIAIGEGYSAISVVGDRLYTMDSDTAPAMEASPESAAEDAADDGNTVEDGEATQDAADASEAKSETEAPKRREYAVAFDAATGKEIWRVAVGDKLDTQFGNGPRATPTVDGDRVYVLGSFGQLHALAAQDGDVLWSVDFTSEDLGSSRPYWGYSTSPLVAGDLLIVEVGGSENKSYAGLNKATGEVLWTSGEGRPGHNSPLAVTLHEQEQFVYLAGQKLRSIDAEGNELWSYDWPPGETHAMPLFIAPDMIYASGTEGIGAVVVKINKVEGGMEVEELWKNTRMKNHFSSSVLHDGYIYGFDNATLKCIDAMTGEQAWAKRGFGKGSLILADGHLLMLSDLGVLVSIEATSEAYKEKSRVQALDGKSWTAPSLANGKLYLRNHSEMVCYDLKG